MTPPLINHKTTLADQIRDLVNAQGADEVTITLGTDQALALVHLLDHYRALTDASLFGAKVIGAIRSLS